MLAQFPQRFWSFGVDFSFFVNYCRVANWLWKLKVCKNDLELFDYSNPHISFRKDIFFLMKKLEVNVNDLGNNRVSSAQCSKNSPTILVNTIYIWNIDKHRNTQCDLRINVNVETSEKVVSYTSGASYF